MKADCLWYMSYRKVPWCKPDISEEEVKTVMDVMQSKWLGMGPKNKQFENELCSFVGAKNSVALNNGTSALIIALLANGISPGDEAILPTFTFIATVNNVLSIGAKPILVDCDFLTFNAPTNLTSWTISEHPTTKAAKYPAGMPSDIDEMREIASKKNLVHNETIGPKLSNRENQTRDIVKMAPGFGQTLRTIICR